MEDERLTQRAVAWAWAETWQCLSQRWAVVSQVAGDLIIGGGGAAAIASFTTPPLWMVMVVGVGGASIASVLLWLAVFAWQATVAPFKQRNELRTCLMELRADNPFTVNVDNEDSGWFVDLDPAETYARLTVVTSRRVRRVSVWVESFTLLRHGHEMQVRFQPRKLQWSSFEARKQGPRWFLDMSPGDPPRFVDVLALNRQAATPAAELITKDRFRILEPLSIIGVCVSSDSPDKGIFRENYLVRILGDRPGIGNKAYLTPLTPELKANALKWSKAPPLTTSSSSA